MAEYTLTSAALRSERGLTVYQPPGTGRPVPGCLLAGGEAVREFGPALDAAIEAGAVPPVLLVGLHNAPGALSITSGLRAREYVPRYARQLPVALGWLLREQGSRPMPRAAEGRRRPARRRPG